MRKNFFVKSVALVVCLVLIGISASGLLATEKKASRGDVRLLMQRSVDFMTSVFPLVNNFFRSHKSQSLTTNDSSTNIVKPTNDTGGGPRGKGDEF